MYHFGVYWCARIDYLAYKIKDFTSLCQYLSVNSDQPRLMQRCLMQNSFFLFETQRKLGSNLINLQDRKRKWLRNFRTIGCQLLDSY